MSSAERNIGPIEVGWGSDEYKYYVLGDSFYLYRMEERHGLLKSFWPLYGLSPNLVETIGRSSGTTKTVRLSMLLIASSIVVFFSDHNKSIPLLAPFLLLLGAWWFVNAVRKVVPRSWIEARKSSWRNRLFYR